MSFAKLSSLISASVALVATSSFSVTPGVAGLETCGVELAVRLACTLSPAFFVFFLRANIGACSPAGSLMGIASDSAGTCFCFCFLDFLFAFLLVTTGGGELARDTDAEVMEMLSTCSLNGVPGAFRDVTLGLREETLLAVAAADVNAVGTAAAELLVAPVLGTGGGVSALGVPVIRK